ncbi:MAG: hypothetical protein IKN16_10360 [Selenomonadaceae bacterium]|nr:hypothetical protein [Selenomonadaceae bacterium]
MAILRELVASNYQARRLTETWGEYSTSYYGGEKFFHIRTFGSEYRERENLGKVAQQIDLNKEMAEKLVALLKAEFDL